MAEACCTFYGAGDSFIVSDFLSTPESSNPDSAGGFHAILKEVEWFSMLHRGSPVPRLVAVQGSSDGSRIPVYRHPVDVEVPFATWTPSVERIRDVVAKRVGVVCNHALIQLYRTGHDNISEHSDKTLDIAHGTPIISVSLGAQRTLILRSKRPATSAVTPAAMTTATPVEIATPSAAMRTATASADSGMDARSPDGTASNACVSALDRDTRGKDIPTKNPGQSARDIQRVPLPHNSAFVLGPITNRTYTHSIRADKRPEGLKSAGERACDGQRISITFRVIATFYDTAAGALVGQGAPMLREGPEMGPGIEGGIGMDASTTTRAVTGKRVEPGSGSGSGSVESAAEPNDDQRRLMIEAFSAENKQGLEFDWDAVYGRGFHCRC